MADAKRKRKGDQYKYLRLPLATPEESAARREHLIKVGMIIPVLGKVEAYACEHGAPVAGPACPVCGNATVVWR